MFTRGFFSLLPTGRRSLSFTKLPRMSRDSSFVLGNVGVGRYKVCVRYRARKFNPFSVSAGAPHVESTEATHGMSTTNRRPAPHVSTGQHNHRMPKCEVGHVCRVFGRKTMIACTSSFCPQDFAWCMTASIKQPPAKRKRAWRMCVIESAPTSCPASHFKFTDVLKRPLVQMASQRMSSTMHKILRFCADTRY